MNAAALRRTAAHLRAHTGQYNQLEWNCGTGGCVAWHAAMANDPNVIIMEGWMDHVGSDILGLDDGQETELFVACPTWIPYGCPATSPEAAEYAARECERLADEAERCT